MNETITSTNYLTLATDTSSLIILSRAGLIDQLTKYAEFRIPEQVWQELCKGSTPSELELFKTSVTLYPTKKGTPSILWNLKNTDQAVVTLYDQTKPHAILSDDGTILKGCKKHGIPHLCSLSLCAVLYQSRIWNLDETQNALEKVEKVGRYSAWVRKEAHDMVIRP
ncbi:hypothetical protein GF406_02550 [candidate division KSB1 bacterium]|nr:hypothetical protein [candidate division KSB1 bacterium]